MAKIYISSTYSDLKECREAVYSALRALRHDVIAMEDYVASDQRPLDQCLADVAACEIYVGIFAWRYGFVPDKDNPERKSITELEYRQAVKTAKRPLIFLLDENANWPEERIEQGGGRERLKALCKELSNDYIVSFFRNSDELATKVVIAIANLNLRLEESRKISINRMPVTGPDLFGREAELQLLDDAWSNPDTSIVTFVAWGGVGKTALVNHWLRRMAKDHYRGAERVYAWSFYIQGTRDDHAASAEPFIDAALRWFSDPDPTQGSPWDKGERLAILVRRSRTLLLLDGLEPLQHPPNRAGQQEGRLKDPALQACLRELAADQLGLCVITTREQVGDLADYESSSVVRKDLDHLSPQAGAQILRAQGIAGDDDELGRASAEFDGHSLALTLLGSYLKDVCDGDIRRRNEIGSLEDDARHGGHARRVMAAYEKWLGEGPELAVLRLLGLFDRPAPADAIAVLRSAPVIPGLTDALFRYEQQKRWFGLCTTKKAEPLSENDWRRTLANLRRIKLLAEPDARAATESPVAEQTKARSTDELDAHLLVRDHFSQQLRERLPEAWREANNRLYEHLKRTAEELPETVEDMSPLFAAVSHGCAAGRHKEALENVYQQRIQRGQKENFSFLKLGAFGANLAALSGFFDPPWLYLHPVAMLDKSSQGFVLYEAGYCLRALGRLREATDAFKESFMIAEAENEGESAAHRAGELSQAYLVGGYLNEALEYAYEAVEWADRSSKRLEEGMRRRAQLADVLQQLGRQREAEAKFREAEEMQKQCAPERPLLHRYRGFRYCGLLLEQGKYQEVIKRARQTLKWVALDKNPLEIALDRLSLGRAYYLLQTEQKKASHFRKATRKIMLAVDGLRESRRQDHLLHGLLASAELRRLAGDHLRAQPDLIEAQRIAERGGMVLHLCDCHLEWARLWLAQGDPTLAREHWARAEEMVEQMGYHRRDREVEEIARELGEAV